MNGVPESLEYRYMPHSKRKMILLSSITQSSWLEFYWGTALLNQTNGINKTLCYVPIAMTDNLHDTLEIQLADYLK